MEDGSLAAYFDQAIQFMRDGFAEVNNRGRAYALIIALVATFVLTSYRNILYVTAGATLAYLALEIMLPVLADGAAFQLPPDLLQMSYWRKAASLFVGYLIIISVFYLIKRVVLRR